MNFENFLKGGHGCKAISSSSGEVQTEDFYAMVVNEDCVISELYHSNDSTTNKVDSYKFQGLTLKSGMLIVPQQPVGNDVGGKVWFSGIQLSSGSVIIYRI